MTRLFIIVICLFSVALCQAQEDGSWQHIFRQISEVEDLESGAWEEAYELLSDMAEQPIDINLATREELEALPFLTAQQVEDIMAYRYRHGRLQTLGELQMIPSLDYNHRRLLQCFVHIGSTPSEPAFPRLDSLFSWGKHEIMASLKVPFYERAGDKNGYLGYPYKHTLRYKFYYGTRVQAGLLGAQDAGEPFFANDNTTGYDHYAWYLMIRRLKRIEALVVGQYRLSFGMGLIMNGGFNLGKLGTLQNLGRSTNVIRPNSSRMIDGYLQGAATTISLNHHPTPITHHLTLTAYASIRPSDATLNKDDQTVATILTDGYHRTPAEMAKKNNLTTTDAGLHLDFQTGGLHLGATASYIHYSRELRPDTSTLYRRYYPNGTDFLNVGVDYRYVSHRLSIGGETAIDKDGHVATINTISYQPSSTFSIMALQRFYSYRYNALHARSLAEGGRVQNESGIYLGATWRPTRQLQLNVYTDYSYFPWARYLVSKASHAWDNFLSATYNVSSWTIHGRYRLHLRQRDNADKTALTDRIEHRSRLYVAKTLPQGLSLHTQADIVYTDYNDNSFGYMISERLAYHWEHLRLSGGIGYFHTDNYDSRIYIYEQAPLHQFSFPMFYGEGIRYWLMARAELSSHFVLTAKLGTVNYFDRTSIGTGNQKVSHSSMTDLDLQLIVKL